MRADMARVVPLATVGEWAGKFIFWFFAFFSILRVLLFRFVKD